jgi:HSP20 family protein
MLDLRAERRIAEDTGDKGYHRHELRYGTFARRLPLPDGVDPSTVAASSKDGILTVRVPMPETATGEEPTTVAIEKG